MPKRKRSGLAAATADFGGAVDTPPLSTSSRQWSESPPSNKAQDAEQPLAKKRPSAAKNGVTRAKKDDRVDAMVAAASARRAALKEGKSSEQKDEVRPDPEEDEDDEADPGEIKEALSRPPPVNSDYLPLPWKGRLGYACLCTYLRYSNPPIFCSRTTRIASILEHRHPLKDPSQPEHATKNRPDKEQPADVRRGQAFVERLCLANVRDMAKLLRWNDKYGIRFLRLSSEAFPFASHAEYGYRLAPFAADALAEVGRVAAELGHRVTTHPGQYTQLGSPRESVIEVSFRDLEYHDEMLSLLQLPEQQNRDAIMVLHMGGVFGDKAATLDRFRANYARLSPGIKNRLVLENDDVSWHVHDLLPICQELSIPLVLDFHHNNILFDASQMREGTQDVRSLFPAIRETWTRKGMTQKMHYSEPTPAAITPKQRRKHSPRVATLPPCSPDMDLMIEAKDKEQAVFELMRAFRLPGYERVNDMLPHIRRDDNKPVRTPAAKKTSKKGKAKAEEEEEEADEEEMAEAIVPEEEVGMGGPEGRVYWPPGMEDWLRPVKKVVKKKEASGQVKPKSIDQMKAEKAERGAKTELNGLKVEESGEEAPAPKKRARSKTAAATATSTANGVVADLLDAIPNINGIKRAPAKRKSSRAAKASKRIKQEPSPSTLDDDAEEEADALMAEDLDKAPPSLGKATGGRSRKSARGKAKAVSYKVDSEDEGETE